MTNAHGLTGDPALGLKLGLRLNLSAHAVLGQAFMTCRDLARSWTCFSSTTTCWHRPNLQFEDVDERCVLTIVSEPYVTPIEFGYELMYGAMLNTLRGLLNKPALQLRD